MKHHVRFGTSLSNRKEIQTASSGNLILMKLGLIHAYTNYSISKIIFTSTKIQTILSKVFSSESRASSWLTRNGIGICLVFF